MTGSSPSKLRVGLQILSVFAFGASWGICVAGAELTGPTAQDRNVTLSVMSLMRSEHLSRHDLDDEIAQRLLKGFIKSLDPMKLYFYQSDVDEFLTQQEQLDDQIGKGDTLFSYHVFNVLMDRIDERVKTIEELLAMEHDFSVDEEMVTDPDLYQHPISPEEARERWRKRIKYDLLVLRADRAAPKPSDRANGRPPAVDEDPRVRLTRRYRSFAKRMRQTEHDELLEMYLTSLTTAYDPHSSYMSAGTLENFDIMMRLNLEGIGAALMVEDGYTVVSKVIPGGAADRDGRLKAGDRITGVAQGETGALVDVVDMKLSDAVDLIRGKRGTLVRLEVVPVGQTDRQIYNITRDEVKLADSEAQSAILEETCDGRTYRLGVITLPSFYMDMAGAKRGTPDFKSTTRDVARLLEDFRAKEVDCVLIDLRNNGGGSLTEAISLTGLFINEGPVVQVKDKNDRRQHYDDLEEGAAWDGPLVVLANRFSASASEIFAGAIQDYRRGIIVGDKSTHGKGTVQSLLDLGQALFRNPNSPKLGALKLTIQQFYRPNGDSTQNRGVLSDVELPSLTNVLEGISESDLDYALDFEHIDAVEYEKEDLVNPTIVDRLADHSRTRRQQDEGFQRVERQIDRYKEQKAKKSVTLNEEQFLAERAELNAESEEEKQLQEVDEGNSKAFDTKNFYNREAINIALDYLQAIPPGAASQARN